MSTLNIARVTGKAGAFRIVKEPRIIGGREKRVRLLQFVTHDGRVGESHRFDRDEAFEEAMAARPGLVPQAKPAPSVQLLHAIDDSTLFTEVERRGYIVTVP